MRVVKSMALVAVFMECRFDTDLSNLNYFGDFQKKFKSRFPTVSYDEKQVSMIKVNKGSENSSVYMSVNNIGFVLPRPSEELNAADLCDELLKYCKVTLDVTEFTRVGLRFNFVIPMTNLDGEMVAFMEKLISKNAVKQLGTSVGEIELNFMSSLDNGTLRYSFTFVQRTANLTDLPEQGLMADVDYGTTDIDYDSAVLFIRSALSTSELKTKELLNKFFQRGVK